jgi:hypothetical protein
MLARSFAQPKSSFLSAFSPSPAAVPFVEKRLKIRPAALR